MARRKRPPSVIGWREWASLPDLGVDAIKVKVDTGARTSALHAFRLRERDVDGERWVSFEIHPQQRNTVGAARVECRVVGRRQVRSSNGLLQDRPVIRTTIELDDQQWPVDMTLTNRDEMGFRLLIGRGAIRGRFVVDPGRSFLGGRPPADE